MQRSSDLGGRRMQVVTLEEIHEASERDGTGRWMVRSSRETVTEERDRCEYIKEVDY